MHTKTISIILILAFTAPAFSNSSLESERAQTMMASLKEQLSTETNSLAHKASLTPGDQATLQKSAMQKITDMKKKFDDLSNRSGISILERSTLNDLSMMLGNISEKQNFDKDGCHSVRTELKAAFDPLSDETTKPELKETLDVVSILCKDAPQGI